MTMSLVQFKPNNLGQPASLNPLPVRLNVTTRTASLFFAAVCVGGVGLGLLRKKYTMKKAEPRHEGELNPLNGQQKAELRHEGELNPHGQRHVEGRMFYPNGDRYEGGIRNGKMHGKGTMFYLNGDRYEGLFVDDELIDENGKIFFSNGGRYEGGVRNGKMHGKGAYCFPNGTRYEDEFLDGKKLGKGIFVFTAERVCFQDRVEMFRLVQNSIP